MQIEPVVSCTYFLAEALAGLGHGEAPVEAAQYTWEDEEAGRAQRHRCRQFTGHRGYDR